MMSLCNEAIAISSVRGLGEGFGLFRVKLH